MDTKKKILDVALTLFSEKGYGNVYVGQIAEGVGIKISLFFKFLINIIPCFLTK